MIIKKYSKSITIGLLSGAICSFAFPVFGSQANCFNYWLNPNKKNLECFGGMSHKVFANPSENIDYYDVSKGIIQQDFRGDSRRQIASIDKMDYIQKYSVEASNAELNIMLRMCNDDIKEYLKSPSTAFFSNPEVTRFVDKGDGYYKIEGSLDSQNSYGAMIRDKYSCFAAHFGNGDISIYDTYLQSELDRKVFEVEQEKRMIEHELEMMRIRLGY